jgi:hypothetical protein
MYSMWKVRRTFEVVYTFTIQCSHPDFNTSLATPQKVYNISDVLRSPGLGLQYTLERVLQSTMNCTLQKCKLETY